MDISTVQTAGWVSPHAFHYAPQPPPPGDWPRAGIYCRQSKLNEDGSSASPQMQKTAGEGLCQARSYNPVACFQDVGKSGWDPTVKRPGFEEMMDWVRQRKLDVVVIFTLSRLTRQGALEAMKIEAEMRAHGVALISVREPYLDTSDPVGIGIFAIIAGLAKQESDNKQEFIMQARDLARKAGGHLAGNAPFGFGTEKQKTAEGVQWIRLVANEAESAVIRIMVRLAMEGKTTGEIAAYLNDEGLPTPASRDVHKNRTYQNLRSDIPAVESHWSITQIHRTLRDPRIAGMSADRTDSYKFTIRRGEDGQPMHVHDQIISPAEWYLLQERLSGSGKRFREWTRGTATLLAGWDFLRCDCGANQTASGKGDLGKRAQYRCSRSAEARRKMGTGHTANAVVQEDTDDLVARRVFARMLNLDLDNEDDVALANETVRRFAATQDTSGTARELAEQRAQISHTEASLAEIYRDRAQGLYKGHVGNAAFADAVEAMNATLAACQGRIRALEAAQTESIVLPIDEWYGSTDGDEDPLGEGSTWAAWSLVERREFLALWVDYVTVESLPAGSRTRVPLAGRIDITWATAPTDEE